MQGFADELALVLVGFALVHGTRGQGVLFEEPHAGHTGVGSGFGGQGTVQPAFLCGFAMGKGGKAEAEGGSEEVFVHGVPWVGMGVNRVVIPLGGVW